MHSSIAFENTTFMLWTQHYWWADCFPVVPNFRCVDSRFPLICHSSKYTNWQTHKTSITWAASCIMKVVVQVVMQFVVQVLLWRLFCKFYEGYENCEKFCCIPDLSPLITMHHLQHTNTELSHSSFCAKQCTNITLTQASVPSSR
jgi:hypothetical protein